MYVETTARVDASNSVLGVHIVMLAYLAAIAIAELLATTGRMVASELMYIILVFATINLYGIANQRLRNVLPSLLIMPLLQLLSIVVPSPVLPTVISGALIVLSLFVAALMVVSVQNAGMAEIGLWATASPALLLQQLFIGMSGVPLGVALFYVFPLPSDASTSLLSAGLWSVLLLLAIALVEEFVFRGAIQHSLASEMGDIAVLYVAAIYTLLSSSAVALVGQAYPGLIGIAALFGIALFWGSARARTHSILGTAVAHGLLVMMWLIVCPLIFSL